ncbi:MAG: AAA family ATPase [Deltaproteobacteria bacterium CG11_big_fil_rev_8_21_14_0_20_42_23]|nr:MAG: AAA family ATPase [Deltaproteobacteria bacterium CG11_big_fil_rev_8_21_14_0_20_42_23]PJC63437.1 MAG: AAA family ATPase [Deltaproteobacteria bacterium CG_4_9_14_0_2_um_filter_42_21]
MIQRTIEQLVLKRAAQYPVVTLTGPRQSGKSTLCQALFPNYKYLNLEDLALREFASSDPVGFIHQNQGGVILDEIQRVPELCSQIQVCVDANKRKGEFILTGSHNLSVRQSINQSLAGRTAVLELLPFSLKERQNFPSKDLQEILFQGFYPTIFDQNIEANVFLADYIATYVERDVRDLENIRDLTLFKKFLGLCAGRVGQLVNLSNLSNEVGVSSTTLKSWLTILEATYVVYLLKPFYKNLNKRLVKMPKLYFYDTGLMAHLLGIRKKEQLINHPLQGALFENMMIGEMKKQIAHKGLQHELYFYRDSKGVEVDLIVDQGTKLLPIEIKMAQTYSSGFLKNKSMIEKDLSLPAAKWQVVYSGSTQQRSDVDIWNFDEFEL